MKKIVPALVTASRSRTSSFRYPESLCSFEAELRRLQAYMGLRETAKHHQLRGYSLIRRALLEPDRRYELQGGIFYLCLQDLQQLIGLPEGRARQDFFDVIEERRRWRAIALSLPIPSVIFSDDLEAIGRAFTAAMKRMGAGT